MIHSGRLIDTQKTMILYGIITQHDPTSFIETDQGPFMSMSMNSQYDSDFTHAADKTQ